MPEPIKEVEVSFVRRYMQVEHICPVCQTVFQALRQRRYCSVTCQKRRAWERNGAKYNANRKKTKEQTP